MNLILFEEDEIGALLPHDDPRAVHIRDILNLSEGGVFAAGIIGGRSGKGRLTASRAEGWAWTFVDLEDPAPARPLTLVLGCPRPPVARRLLKDMSALGLREIRVCSTDLNEKSYMTSKLWRDGLWREAVIEGAVQGAATLLPAVRTAASLERSLEDLPPEAARIALDNAPDARPFGSWEARPAEAVYAVGPERGWSDRERRVLDSLGFQRLGLGSRVLRTETACSLAAGLILDRLGCFL